MQNRNSFSDCVVKPFALIKTRKLMWNFFLLNKKIIILFDKHCEYITECLNGNENRIFREFFYCHRYESTQICPWSKYSKRYLSTNHHRSGTRVFSNKTSQKKIQIQKFLSLNASMLYSHSILYRHLFYDRLNCEPYTHCSYIYIYITQ